MKGQIWIYKRISLILIVFSLIFLLDLCYAQSRPKIYWTEANSIKRANLNGSAAEVIITNLENPFHLALDMHNQKLYWVNFRSTRIYRANFDGSDIEVIINREEPNAENEKDLPTPYTIAIDTNSSKIYWGNWQGLWGITRSDLDGSNIEDILIIQQVNGIQRRHIVDAEKIQFDVKNSKLYFVDSFNDNIARMNLDGSKYEELGISIPDPSGLVLDMRNRRMYWTHVLFGKIKRATLDGEDVITLLSDLKGINWQSQCL